MLEITSLAQFQALKSKALLVVDFYANWCGPCKQISPVFERLSAQHTSNSNIVFAKVNVDTAQDISQQCGITAMPTFQFYKAGSKVDEVRGADVQQLNTKIGYYTAGVAKTTENGADSKTTADGQSQSAQSTTPTSSGPGSLKALLQLEKCSAVNVLHTGSLQDILKASSATTTSVDSLDGPRLLLYFHFKQAVNITSLKIASTSNSAENAPSKIYIGTHLAESPSQLEAFDKSDAVQTLSLYSDEYTKGVADLRLKASKFKSVQHLAILVDANIAGSGSTKVGWLDFIGTKV